MLTKTCFKKCLKERVLEELENGTIIHLPYFKHSPSHATSTREAYNSISRSLTVVIVCLLTFRLQQSGLPLHPLKLWTLAPRTSYFFEYTRVATSMIQRTVKLSERPFPSSAEAAAAGCVFYKCVLYFRIAF